MALRFPPPPFGQLLAGIAAVPARTSYGEIASFLFLPPFGQLPAGIAAVPARTSYLLRFSFFLPLGGVGGGSSFWVLLWVGWLSRERADVEPDRCA